MKSRSSATLLTGEGHLRPDKACCDPQAVIAACAGAGLRPLRPEEVAPARQAATARLGEGIASAACFGAVHELTGGAALFGYDHEAKLSGFLGGFPVRAAAVPQLLAGRFNGVEVDLDLVARPGETPAAWYGWGFTATGRRAAAAVVRGAQTVRDGLFWAVPAFTRAATGDGERVILGRLGYVRLPGSLDASMMWKPAASAGRTP